MELSCQFEAARVHVLLYSYICMHTLKDKSDIFHPRFPTLFFNTRQLTLTRFVSLPVNLFPN